MNILAQNDGERLKRSSPLSRLINALVLVNGTFVPSSLCSFYCKLVFNYFKRGIGESVSLKGSVCITFENF